jgi:hypothetical protein
MVQPDDKKYWLTPGDEEADGAKLDEGVKSLIDYLEIRENGK